MAKKESTPKRKAKEPPKANYAGNVILHISDLHFEDDPNQTAKRTNILNDLIYCLNNVTDDWKPNIICITGDISDKNKIEGYKIAKDWIERLRKGLNIQRKNIILCPGNHDIDDNKAKNIVRPISTKEANDTFIAGRIPPNYKNLFSRFTGLCEKLKLTIPVYGDFNSFIFGIRKINNIYFLVCNSCWFFKNIESEDLKGMRLGYPLFEYLESKNELSSKKNSNLIIALSHHPDSKLHDDDIYRYDRKTSTWQYIREVAELILTGDLHSLPLRSSDTINCGPLAARDDIRNVFCLIKLLDGKCKYRYYVYDHSRPINKWGPEGKIYTKQFKENEDILNDIADLENPKIALDILKKSRAIGNIAKRISNKDKQETINNIRNKIVNAQRKIEMFEYEESFTIAESVINKLKEIESSLPNAFLTEVCLSLADIEITRVNWHYRTKGVPKDYSRVKEYYRKAKEYNEKI